MKLIRMIFALFLCSGLLSCASSQITTKNSLITTIYIADKPQIIDSYVKVVQGMEHYIIKLRTENQVVVKYSHPGLLMGSATVKTDFAVKTGMINNGQKVTGIELIYTDVTPLFSQDSTFSGADIIDRIKLPFDEYMTFKNIKYHLIENL